MEEQFCKRCEIMKQFPEDMKRYILRYIEQIREEDRASEEQYTARLTVCFSCDKRTGSTCNACGCFVELRAAAEKSECPYHLWK